MVSVDRMPIDRRPERGVGLLPGLLILALLGGCSAVVTRPPAPDQPLPVFLVDHGRSVSLVLSHEEALTRWAYGDWQWYALRNTGSGPGMRALFAPSQAALGRYRFEGPPTLETVDRRVRVPIQELFEIEAEAERVRALNARLVSLFEQERAAAVHNAAYGLEFVPYPEPYTLGHNSNHVAADWLRELGCTVEGDPTLGKWRVRDAVGTPPRASSSPGRRESAGTGANGEE